MMAASNCSPNAGHGSVCGSGTPPALLRASPEPLGEEAAPCLCCRHVGNSLPVSRPRPCQLKPSSSLITSPPPSVPSRQPASLAATRGAQSCISKKAGSCFLVAASHEDAQRSPMGSNNAPKCHLLVSFEQRDGAFQQQVESIKSPNQPATKAQASGGLTSKMKCSLC